MSSLRGFTLDLVEQLAIEAGDMVRDAFSTTGVVPDYKGVDEANRTPVTATDRRVNAFVLESLRAKFPTDELSLVGEEDSDPRPGAPYQVVVDPIDGTFPYAHGIPIATFMLALLEQGVPTIGVIYDPFGRQMYLAERGAGATLNGAPIRVGSFAGFGAETIVGACWWGTSKWYVGELAAALPRREGASVVNFLSVGYAASRVASGQLAASVFPGTDAHDTAAAHVIVTEAGGVMTDLFGEPLDYSKPLRGHLAANAVLHGRLVELMCELNSSADRC